MSFSFNSVYLLLLLLGIPARCNSIEMNSRFGVLTHFLVARFFGSGHFLSHSLYLFLSFPFRFAFIISRSRLNYGLFIETVSIRIRFSNSYELTPFTYHIRLNRMKAYFSFIWLSSTLFAVFAMAQMKRKKRTKRKQNQLKFELGKVNTSRIVCGTFMWTKKCISHHHDSSFPQRT